MATGNVVIVGGTHGQGRELAQSYADDGRDVVVTGRDQARADAAASEIGGNTRASASISPSHTRSRITLPTWATSTISSSLRSSVT